MNCRLAAGAASRHRECNPSQEMRKMKLRLVLAGALLASGVAMAAAETVVISPQQETVIRTYVQDRAVASIDLPGVELSIGTSLPETVEVHRIDQPDVIYSYAVIGGKTYLVEPETRKVVYILN
jgi:hypothetical protein